MASPARYHLEQFSIGTNMQDPRRVCPEIPTRCTDWLDVGCGAGALLTTARNGMRAIGVDYDFDALCLGKTMRVAAPTVCSMGEHLPFASESFDFLSSRVALPYMNIRAALSEFARVLRPGGQVWLALHPLSRFKLGSALAGPFHLAYEIYRLTNTAVLHFGMPQFRCPEPRKRCESYQTDAGMRRELTRAGFTGIVIRREPHYVVTANRPRTL